MVVDESVKTGRLLMFRVGSKRFAVLLEDVRGVQEPAAIVQLPDRRVMFQGQPVAALDARGLWLGGEGRQETMASPAAIVVNGNGGPVALLVDRIEGIIEGVEMRPLPALVSPFVRGLFRGVTLHADGDRLVIDTAALSGAAAAGGQRGPGKA